ncbi:MAG: cysteine synthase A [Deltaproteobacteria bacterium]|nr:cysteine synthase A [Deltaproteobacteria bacterium]
MPIRESITDCVGHTPLVRLRRLTEGLDAEVLVKVEAFNPLSSVKDRIALGMIEDAEASGLLGPDMTLVEATSGNTGIGLAFVGAARGYPVVIYMPENMSRERVLLLKALGAEVILTPAGEGMRGAIAAASERAGRPGHLSLRQFANPANPATHLRTTARELLDDTGGRLDTLVAGVGTGGTITGLARGLRAELPHLRVIAVEPVESAVLSGGEPGPHRLMGIGAGFVPEVVDPALIDEVIQVSAEDAGAAARDLARREGILAGISSGAALWAALQVAARPESAGKRIAVVLPDSGERYLSTWLFEDGGR